MTQLPPRSNMEMQNEQNRDSSRFLLQKRLIIRNQGLNPLFLMTVTEEAGAEKSREESVIHSKDLFRLSY